jgi:hypothetical protein
MQLDEIKANKLQGKKYLCYISLLDIFQLVVISVAVILIISGFSYVQQHNSTLQWNDLILQMF